MYLRSLPGPDGNTRYNLWLVGKPTGPARRAFAYQRAPKWLRFLCNLPFYIAYVGLVVGTLIYSSQGDGLLEFFAFLIGFLFGSIGLTCLIEIMGEWITRTGRDVDIWHHLGNGAFKQLAAPTLLKIDDSLVFQMMESRNPDYQSWGRFHLIEWLADHPLYKQTIDQLLTNETVIRCIETIEQFTPVTRADVVMLARCRDELRAIVAETVEILDRAADVERGIQEAHDEEARRVAQAEADAAQAAARADLAALLASLASAAESRRDVHRKAA